MSSGEIGDPSGEGRQFNIQRRLMETDPDRVFLQCVGMGGKIARSQGDEIDSRVDMTPRQTLQTLKERLRQERETMDALRELPEGAATDISIGDMGVSFLLVSLHDHIVGEVPQDAGAETHDRFTPIWNEFDQLLEGTLAGEPHLGQDFDTLIFYAGLYFGNTGPR
jgi:hypothetical protein